MVTPMDVRVEGSKVFFEEGSHTFQVTFHRTLRLPEDGKKHQLPPSLGAFPIKRVDDYKDKVPASWVEHGGVFFPMWQREAMWLGFSGMPTAVKVAAGKINAVSGKPWSKTLAEASTGTKNDPIQDYMVAPTQRWLDGFNVGDGVIKQFVAMPLGMGYSVEGQVTGKEEFGGLQLLVVPPKEGKIPPHCINRGFYESGVVKIGTGGGLTKGVYGAQGVSGSAACSDSSGSSTIGASFGSPLRSANVRSSRAVSYNSDSRGVVGSSAWDQERLEEKTSGGLTKAAEMGLGMGGQMVQKIYPDPYGIDVWNQGASGKLFVHIVNSQMYEQITGEKPPASPITAQTYTQHGYPWYAVYDEHMGDVPKSETLGGVKTLSEMDKTKGFEGQQNDSPISETVAVTYPVHKPGAVRNGAW